MNIMFVVPLKTAAAKKVRGFRFRDSENCLEVKPSKMRVEKDSFGSKIIFEKPYVKTLSGDYPIFYLELNDDGTHRFLAMAPQTEAVFKGKKTKEVSLIFRGC